MLTPAPTVPLGYPAEEPGSNLAAPLRALLDLVNGEPSSLSASAFGALRELGKGQLLDGLSPRERWQFLACGLMSTRPDAFLRGFRDFDVLAHFLPEVKAWYGVPQMGDGPELVDVGVHQERVLALAAKLGLGLPVRFAALMHKIGKGSTPREIWPSHYKHEQRGHLALDAIAQRFGVPQSALDLAHLAIDEADRVHRASPKRAGALTMMIARIGALEQPERFEQLLALCSCDYAAYEGHSVEGYKKASILRLVAQACATVDVNDLDEDEVLEVRTEVVVDALQSWTRTANDGSEE